jgi:ABC-2 type transport system ATP-binding protein
MSNTEAAFDARSLTKRFGTRTVLDAVSFSISPGEIVALLGPNGAGKSTLIGCLLGFLLPDSGSSHMLGHDVREMPREARARTGYVPQTMGGFGSYRVGQLLAYLAAFYPGAPTPDPVWLSWAALDPKARVSTLSGGQKQRLAILLALQHRPEALILDEPVASLDPQARHDFMHLLSDYCTATGASVVISSHILSDLEKVCSRLIFMRRGVLVLDVPTTTFHAATRRLTPAPGAPADWTCLLPQALHVVGHDPGTNAALVGNWPDHDPAFALDNLPWPIRIERPDLEAAYLEITR